jgi:predicted amidohydrolase
VPTVWGASKRSDIFRNIDHHREIIKAACWLSDIDLPVKLIIFPEGALQGFNDEVLDVDHADYANNVAIDIPGPETDALAEIARDNDVYIMAQAKAKHPDFPDRFFNIGFILDNTGEIILRHHKLVTLLPVEHSMTPHDVYDWWIEKYGRNLQAFWPVVDTPLGRMGIMMANEASYPENARGLAMNGCEIAYRASIPHPAASNDYFEIQNRARALDNNMFVVAPNMGTYYLNQDSETAIDTFGGGSMIVNYRGQIVGKHNHSGTSSFVSGPIDIHALRHHRNNSQWTNWMKDLKTEMVQIIYEQPVFPKNLYADRLPMKHAEYRQEVTQKQIRLMQERGIWAVE